MHNLSNFHTKFSIFLKIMLMILHGLEHQFYIQKGFVLADTYKYMTSRQESQRSSTLKSYTCLINGIWPMPVLLLSSAWATIEVFFRASCKLHGLLAAKSHQVMSFIELATHKLLYCDIGIRKGT